MLMINNKSNSRKHKNSQRNDYHKMNHKMIKVLEKLTYKEILRPCSGISMLDKCVVFYQSTSMINIGDSYTEIMDSLSHKTISYTKKITFIVGGVVCL